MSHQLTAAEQMKSITGSTGLMFNETPFAKTLMSGIGEVISASTPTMAAGITSTGVVTYAADYPVLRAGSTGADRLMWATYLTTHFRSKSAGEPVDWARLVLSYLHATIPDEAVKWKNTSPIPLTDGENTRWEAWKKAVETAQEENLPWSCPSTPAGNVTQVQLDALKPIIDTDFPIPEPMDSVTMAHLSVVCMYGVAGMIIYSAGREINDGNRTRFETTRPMNIVNKYKLQAADCPTLVGTHKISRVAQAGLMKVWAYYPSLREDVVFFASSIVGSGHQLPYDIMGTVTNLLSMSGMASVAIIGEFLMARPECFENDQLVPYIVFYSKSLEEWMTIPAERRRFAKAAKGDHFKMFLRSNLTPLLSVAMSYAVRTRPTLAQYSPPPDAGLHVEQYNRFLKKIDPRGLKYSAL